MTNDNLNLIHALPLAPEYQNTIVSAVCVDYQKRVWVGTDGGGILLFDEQMRLLQQYNYRDNDPSSLGNDAVLSFFEDSKKRMWIGTYRGGLNLFVPEKNAFKRFVHDPKNNNSVADNDIRKIQEDKAGNLWLVVHGRGISQFNPATEIFTNYLLEQTPWTSDELFDANGTFWACTYNGLIRKLKNEKQFQNRFTHADLAAISTAELYCIHRDRQNVIWVGGVDGLYQITQLKGKTQVRFLSQFEGIKIKSINEDARGYLWLGSNQGVYRMNAKTFNCQKFTELNGLLNNDIVANSSFIIRDKLYVGTPKGLCWLDVSKVNDQSQWQAPVISDLNLFNSSVLSSAANPKLSGNIFNAKKIEFQYDENHLKFTFALPSYSSVDKSFFEYKMLGIDKQWQSAGEDHEAIYSALPPGNYTLQVRQLKDATVHAVLPITSLEIIVFPPFWQTWWARSLAVIIVLLLVYWYVRFKINKVQKQNEILDLKVQERTKELYEKSILLEEQRLQLEVSNSAKEKLFSIIAHDLRSPFSAVLLWAEVLEEGSLTTNKQAASNLRSASKNAFQTLENLLDWSKTQTNRIVFSPDWLNLNSFCKRLTEIYALKAKSKSLEIDFFADKELDAIADKNMLETIVRNLLDNAIKFTKEGGRVSLSIMPTASGFDLQVKDEGKGLSAEQVENLMNLKAVSAGTSPSGLGLYLCKEFLNLHEASWDITSSAEHGTAFLMHFTCVCKVKELEIAVAEEKLDDVVIHRSLVSDKDAPILKQKVVLVVEDQMEIRKLLVHHLSPYFIVEEACDGDEALRMVGEIMPDLIISDIVMPNRNGLDFCLDLKANVVTCHIPIFLLTSKKEESDIVNGLKTGADDYLIKPFEPKILILKVAQKLLNHDRLKKKYRMEDEASLSAMAENSVDQLLLKKVHKTIEDNLANEDFGVEMLSETVGMHRSTFSKKLTAIIGVPPQELIKMQRLKHASQLLVASDKTISEISYRVGFSDPKYFTKIFKSYFGKVPSEYQAENKSL
ncbi:MAG: response regulator [Bacteroidetes bacterium]|nr:response regulator [Bacteroidota bacterium]